MMRRRVRRWELGDNDKTLDALLRRTRVQPAFGVFDRATGDPVPRLYRQTVEREDERDDTFVTGDTETRRALVELDGERDVTVRRDGVEVPTSYWHADGRTYLETVVEPEATYTLRSRPVSAVVEP